MSIPTYVEGYPQDGSSLGNTRVQIRKNLDGTFETLSVDHQNQNETNPGYHAVVHWETQGSDPLTVSNITQEYTKTDSNSIQQKWLFSTGGKAYQQTRMIDGDFSTFGTNPGWTYLPGGLILQYGVDTSVNNVPGSTINYPITFPNSVFVVVCTVQTSSSATIRFSLANAPGNGSFTTTQTASPSFTALHWYAIGN